MSTWTLEPGHTEAEFRARHMMITWVRGLFKDVHGTLEFDRSRCLDTRFEGSMDAAKIWTGEPDRDAHLRSADFLDAENHPTIAFTGRFVERTGDTHFKAIADLTLRGVTRPVELDVTYLGEWATPFWEGTRTAGRSGGSGSRGRASSTATTTASPGRTTCRAGAWSSPTRSR